jgi:hypothetical protein
MIVNGGISNLIVWKQKLPVLRNTNYNFECWISSLVNYNLAKLKFKINGTALSSDFTAPSNPNIWVKFSSNWQSGANDSAIIEIYDNYDVLPGNDFGIDDLKFTAQPSFLWSNGATTPSITVTPTQTTTYTCTVSNGINSCPASVTVNVSPAPQALFSSDSIVATCNRYTLNAAGGNDSYNWPNGANTSSISINQTGWYRCTSSIGSCSATDSIYVFVPTNSCDSTSVTARFPTGISYQAVARDSMGQILSNINLIVRFTLKDSAISGRIVYAETDSVTTNRLGLFTAIIGNGNAQTNTYAGINWMGAPKFLQVEIDKGNGFQLIGVQQLLSVPYANAAKTATYIENPNLPVYNNNAAAVQGGLKAGALYRTATGVLMVVY